MNKHNKYRYFKIAAENLLRRKTGILIFNKNIGWVVVDHLNDALQSDLLSLSITGLKNETLNDEPAGIATWQALTVKHNLHDT